MPDDDDANGEHTEDIPTFGDLVDQLSTGPRSAASDTLEDLASDPTDSSEDGSGWEWVGDAESPEGPDPEPRQVGRGDRRSSTKVDTVVDLLDDESSVLLVGPREVPTEYELCARLLDQPPEAPHRRLLVTTDQSTDERLSVLRGYGLDGFDETTILAVGDQSRSGDGRDTATRQLGDRTVTIATIRNPSDLTRLGLLLNRYLAERPEGPPALCIHSLTSLLQFVGIEKLFRFAHVLQARVRETGARAHYHLDPTDIPDEHLIILAHIFDFTIEFDADGDVAIDA